MQCLLVQIMHVAQPLLLNSMETKQLTCIGIQKKKNTLASQMALHLVYTSVFSVLRFTCCPTWYTLLTGKSTA